jgi:hypothetical protein
MRNLFEAEARTEVLTRLQKVNGQSQRQWGEMSVDQMLWHMNSAMSFAMGEYPISYKANWFVKTFFKGYVLGNSPFPKGGAKTITEFKATGKYDIETEKKKLKDYVEQYSKLGDKKDWPQSPLLGKLSGADWARLNYKHIDHHFKQFGA